MVYRRCTCTAVRAARWGASGYRKRFELSKSRVIGFEQRGCGRSTPHASDPETSMRSNTTAHLIADIEALRKARGVDSWILNGVSWGSTLALAYAQAHPERVNGIVLFAVTTTCRQEVEWITEGAGMIFPEAWAGSPHMPKPAALDTVVGRVGSWPLMRNS
ncbi:alpha/beta fold hydrolase [Arthrobacter psychrolactophilus]